MKSNGKNQFKTLLFLTLTFITFNSLASIISLEFEATNLNHYRFVAKPFTTSLGTPSEKVGAEHIEYIGSASLRLIFDTNATSTSDRTVTGRYHHSTGDIYEVPTRDVTSFFSLISLELDLEIEANMRALDPNYNGNSTNRENVQMAERFSDYSEFIDKISAPLLKPSVQRFSASESLSSYLPTDFHFQDGSKESHRELFTFFQSISFENNPLFDSLDDPEIYPIDEFLKSLYKTGARYGISQLDRHFVSNYNSNGDLISFEYSRLIGNGYTSDLKLTKINGINADEYLQEVPEPRALIFYALILIGFRARYTS